MTDHEIRLAAFAFLKKQTALHDDIVPYQTLLDGFTFEGHRVPLIGPQGIFKPAVLDLPLSFYTAPPKPGQPAPYHDELGPDGLLHYRYRGTDPTHRDNVGMKRAMEREALLIYLLNPHGSGGVRVSAEERYSQPRTANPPSPRSVGRTRHPDSTANVMMG